MRRCLCVWAALLLAGLGAAAQDGDVLRAALYLSGAGDVEQVDPGLVASLEACQGWRIRINGDGLRPGLLLSAYQVAAIRDYRGRSGDILSWEELALVDGFSQEAVAALRPFLSLASDRLPGAADTVGLRASALLRTTLKQVGIKAKLSGEHVRAGGAWRGKDGTFYGEYQWRGFRVLAGDYQLRTGQGLAFWSGFSMESLTTADAFLKRGQGISPVWSFTSGNVCRGAAVEYGSRHVQLGAFVTTQAKAGLHAAWLGRSTQLGLTAACPLVRGRAEEAALSLDGRGNLWGADWAFEAAWHSGAWAGQAAFRTPAGDRWKLVGQARVLPSRFRGKKNGEYALAAGAAFRSDRRVEGTPAHTVSLTLDNALLPVPGGAWNRFQLRACALWEGLWSPAWGFSLRLQERYRNYERPRTDLRADVRFRRGPWLGTWRGELVRCEQTGLLTYLEGGYKAEAYFGYLRLTAFRADQWNDRIYCYERDAPGNFSVPAYAGRGVALSALTGGKVRWGRFRLKAYMRAGCQLRVGREPAYTLNLQLQADV